MNELVRQIGPVAFFLGLAIVDLSARAPWMTLKDCRYIKNPSDDGDSFHVRMGRKETIFRLYFVDAPETDRGLGLRHD
jgi:hypothetical protein